MSVSLFKEKIANEIGVPVEQQRLIFRGKALKDDQFLAEYRIPPSQNSDNYDTVFLLSRLMILLVFFGSNFVSILSDKKIPFFNYIFNWDGNDVGMLICRNRKANKNMFHKNCHLQTKIIIIDMLKLLLYHINSALLNMSWSNVLLLKRHLFCVASFFNIHNLFFYWQIILIIY